MSPLIRNSSIRRKRKYLRFDNQLFCYDVSASAVYGLAGSQVVQHLPPKLDLSVGDRRLLVPIYVATSADVVTRMLQEVDLRPGQQEIAKLVTIEPADLYTANLGKAGVITLCLLPNQPEKLLPFVHNVEPSDASCTSALNSAW